LIYNHLRKQHLIFLAPVQGFVQVLGYAR